MELTAEEATQLCAGRNPWYWNFLDGILSDPDWNAAVANYNGLESDLDSGNKYGLDVAPNRPRPTSRP